MDGHIGEARDAGRVFAVRRIERRDLGFQFEKERELFLLRLSGEIRRAVNCRSDLVDAILDHKECRSPTAGSVHLATRKSRPLWRKRRNYGAANLSGILLTEAR